MNQIEIETPAGKLFINDPSDYSAVQDQLIRDGIPVSDIALSVSSLRAWAKQQIADFAEDYRAQIASTSAGKIAEYRIKEEIASDPDLAAKGELELISREAQARGVTLEELISLIKKQSAAYRKISLLIGTLEAEANAAISAIPDDAENIEMLVVGALDTAKQAAQTEYSNVAALLADTNDQSS